jgi:hypothetical protein
MKKIFDVHFNVVFSDFFSAIEANSPQEAKEIAKEWLKNADDLTRKKLVNSLIQDIQCGYLDFALTETLESFVEEA